MVAAFRPFAAAAVVVVAPALPALAPLRVPPVVVGFTIVVAAEVVERVLVLLAFRTPGSVEARPRLPLVDAPGAFVVVSLAAVAAAGRPRVDFVLTAVLVDIVVVVAVLEAVAGRAVEG